MTYFLAYDVCAKLGIRNSVQTYKTYNLIEGRDYIKFKQSMNTTLFKRLIDEGCAHPTDTSLYIFTIIGLIEVLFKSKSTATRAIKDEMGLTTDYKFYESYGYKLVSEIVGNLSADKRQKFYQDESYALDVVRKKGGVMTEEVLDSIRLIRSFANGVYRSGDVESADLSVLNRYFKCFSI